MALAGVHTSTDTTQTVYKGAWLFVIVAISVMLAIRPMPVTFDDGNYLHAFLVARYPEAPNWWRLIVDEPLWQLLTYVLGNALQPEQAYRLILFVSPLIFFLAGNRIANPGWLVISRRSVLLVAAMLLSLDLATGLYSAAVRQGLATSVFLLFVAAWRAPLLGAIVAGCIHSAYLIAIPALVVALLFFRYPRWAWAIVAAGLGVVALLAWRGLIPSLDTVDLGRRGEVYTEDVAGLSLIGAAIISVLVLAPLAIQWRGLDWREAPAWRFWAVATAGLLATLMVLSLLNGGFLRLSLTITAFLIFALLQTRKGWVGLAPLAVWAALSVGLQMYESSRTLEAGWFERWHWILG